jgi:hypothetical protein
MLMASHLGIADFYAWRVAGAIDFAFDVEAGTRRRCCDQLHDRPITDPRIGARVLGVEREQLMFDFVPFAGAWRQMTDGNRQPEFIGEGLQFAFP